MSQSVIDRQVVILSQLRASYEQDGYEFFQQPPRSMIPDFLGRYVPDAIARKHDHSIVIEVKIGRERGADPRLSEIAKMVSGHPGWEFRVYFVDDLLAPEDEVPSASITGSRIEEAVHEVDELAQQGHRQAAFLLGWSILEAIFRSLNLNESPDTRRPLSVAQLVQALEMDGLLDEESARTSRELNVQRNRLAHGDINLRIGPEEMKQLVGQIRKLSSATTTQHAGAAE